MKKALPQASGHDILTLIATEWKFMPDVDKQIYIDMVKEKKREFREAGGYELLQQAKLRTKEAKMGRTRSQAVIHNTINDNLATQLSGSTTEESRAPTLELLEVPAVDARRPTTPDIS